MKTLITILLIPFMLVLFTNTACYAGVIKGCYQKDGQLRIANSCRPSETSIQWNIEGPAGSPGPTGPPGPAGVLEFYVVDVTNEDLYYDSVKVGHFAYCNEGDIVISCGYHIYDDDLQALRVTGVIPQYTGPNPPDPTNDTRRCMVEFTCAGHPSCPAYPASYYATTYVRAVCAHMP
jgi:hypothetical protein